MGHIGRSTGTEVKDQTLREDKEESEGQSEKKQGAPGHFGSKILRDSKGSKVKDQTLREDKEGVRDNLKKNKGPRDTFGQKICRTIKGHRREIEGRTGQNSPRGMPS